MHQLSHQSASPHKYLYSLSPRLQELLENMAGCQELLGQQCTTYFRETNERSRCVGSQQKRITRLELSLVLLCASPLQKRAICTQTKVPSQRQWKAAASFSE